MQLRTALRRAGPRPALALFVISPFALKYVAQALKYVAQAFRPEGFSLPLQFLLLVSADLA